MAEDKNDRLQYLFQRYLTNRITEEEYTEFWELLQQGHDKETLSTELQALWEKTLPEKRLISPKHWDEKMARLINEAPTTPPVTKAHKTNRQTSFKWRALAAVALVIFLVGGGIYLFQKTAQNKITATAPPAKQKKQKGLQPGGNKATLTLSNGARIVLDSATKGTITQQGKTNVVQPANGQLAYKPLRDIRLTDVVYNTLRTPRGGKYQITLPDGTKVWLNAASSLRFPTAFPGKKRMVEMTGEAYFEVAANATKPFIVLVDGMTVNVLGTHFNIMAYDDEPVVKTTLLEGAIKLTPRFPNGDKQGIKLKPGQQARLNKQGDITVLNQVKTAKVVAWKNNLFWFEENDIHEVMRQIARWYNADVVIKGDIPQHFTGSIPKNVNVLRVFQILQETGNMNFSIDDHKIIVTP